MVAENIRYVLTLDAVRRAITTLKPLTIHETFPAYLHLRRRAAVLRRFTDLAPDWKAEPHDWLSVPGGPANKPYFRPFTSRGSKPDSFWLNDNLAGSYAPSSLRGLRYLYVDSNDTYHLPTHPDGSPNAAVIRSEVLGGHAIPAWVVAAFLFRNRSFEAAPTSTPDWVDLLGVFEDYFQWTDDEHAELFEWAVPTVPCFIELEVAMQDD